MDNHLIFIAILVLGAFAGALAYFNYRQAKKRREALAAIARQLGWHFDPRRDSAWDSRYPYFEWFQTGHSRAAYNLMWGSLEMDGKLLTAIMGDYTYKITTNSGKSSSTQIYYFSFLLVDLPFITLPELCVRREGMFDRLTAFLGFDDIDFESEAFSRKFHVKCSDKRFAYDLLHPQMMEYMLATAPPQFEIERGKLCARHSVRWEPEEFAQVIEWCEQFLSHWPRHMTADFTSRGVE